MKKILCAIGILLNLSLSWANTVPSPTLAAKSWLLLDATSNQVIAAQEPTLRIEPASLTKIMTAYVTFVALKEKRLLLDQKITVSARAWKVDASSSKMFIDPATPVTVNDLLYGLMVQSGNDAAVTLAEAVAGDEATFVTLMNREAARMGLSGTHFANPHGLPHPENYSTAQDLATLAAHVISDFPEFYKIDSVKSFTYNKITQLNRNRLLWADPSVDGMKTGHTEGAGYCMIASAKRPNGTSERRLISVVLGTASDAVRVQESQKILNWGFQNFDAVRLYAKDQSVATPTLWKGTKNQVKLGFVKDTYVTVPKGKAEQIKTSLNYKTPLIAPITQNKIIGTLQITLEGAVIAAPSLVALESVERTNIVGRAWDTVRLWFQ